MAPPSPPPTSPPPLTPPSPPLTPPLMPPLGPGEALQPVVELTLVVAGELTAFNQDDFKVSLANAAGVAPTAISLKVSQASIRVVATIEVADESAATGLVSTLQSVSSNATAFGELLGVAVESVEAPLAKSILLAAPVPPPSQPPSGPPQTPPSAPPDLVGYLAAFVSENSDDPVIIGSAVGGVAVLCLCVLLCIFLCCRRRKRRGAVHKKLKGDTAAPAEEMVKADSDVLATKDDPMVADEGAAIARPQASTAQPNNLPPAARLPQAAEEEHKTPRDRQAKGNGAHVAVHESATNEAPHHHHHHNQAHRSEHPSKAAGEWYYGHAESQKQFGPVPVDKIKQLLAEGQPAVQRRCLQSIRQHT